MVDQSIIDSVKAYLSALEECGIVPSFGVIFGSTVRGKSDLWSDIDLLVISPCFDNLRSRNDVDFLWRVAARVDKRIEPMPCGEKRWKEDTSNAIIEIARREGQTVLLRE